MKNFVILGLVSLLLFSVAAGLSMWLQQQSQKATAAADEKAKEKPAKKGLKDDEEKPTAEAKSPPKTEPKLDKPESPAVIGAELKGQRAELDRRELRYQREKAQQAVVFEDLRAFREEVERLNKKLTEQSIAVAQATLAQTPPPVPAVPPATLPKFGDTRPTPAAPKPDLAEQKSIERMAVIFEAMPPETAAKQFQEMCDTGKMDAVVKVLVAMRERQAGKVLAEFADRTLAGQIVDRMLLYKQGGTGTTPPTKGGN